mgnify:CR=1 FL=1
MEINKATHDKYARRVSCPQKKLMLPAIDETGHSDSISDLYKMSKAKRVISLEVREIGMKANTVPVTVYTEDEWMKHMERNGKRLFKRWLRKQMIAWLKVIIAVAIILTVVTISGALADAIVRL